MSVEKEVTPEVELIRARGKIKKYAGIILIAGSITGLIVTPPSMRWLILFEGILGIIGIVIFVYARIQYWREVSRLIKH
jgi:hypothetical protein